MKTLTNILEWIAAFVLVIVFMGSVVALAHFAPQISVIVWTIAVFAVFAMLVKWHVIEPWFRKSA